MEDTNIRTKKIPRTTTVKVQARIDVDIDVDDRSSVGSGRIRSRRIRIGIARARGEGPMLAPNLIRTPLIVETTTIRSDINNGGDANANDNANGDSNSNISSCDLNRNPNDDVKERDPKWLETHNQLVFYRMAHNRSTNVPKGSTRFKKLANWVKTQRTHYSMGKLSQERIDILESLGLQWRLVK